MSKEQLKKELLELVKQLDREHEKLMAMIQPISNPSVGKEPKVWSRPEWESLKSQMKLEDNIFKHMKDVIEALASLPPEK